MKSGKNKKTFIITLLSILIIYFGFAGCNTTEPGNRPELNIVSVKSISSTETWLQIKAVSSESGTELIIKRDDKEIFRRQFPITDSIIYDDNLSPGKLYTYQVNILANGKSIDKPVSFPIKTLNATSHDYTWQKWVIGADNGSIIKDVCIINENDIWAVGAINLPDSAGNPQRFSGVHWDGTSWNIFKLEAKSPWMKYILQPTVINYFSDDSICFQYSGIHFYNGIKIVNSAWLGEITGGYPEWTSYPYSMFGFSASELYIGGGNGQMAKYKDSKWMMINTGVTSDIQDIFGFRDPVTQKRTLYCAASFILEAGEMKLLTIDESDKVDSINWNTGRRIKSIWTENGCPVYICGGGVFENKKGNWQEVKDFPLYFTKKIRGSKLNDIIVGGDFGLLAHYNGINWKLYKEFLDDRVSYTTVAINGNIVVAAGYLDYGAFIMVGKR